MNCFQKLDYCCEELYVNKDTRLKKENKTKLFNLVCKAGTNLCLKELPC